MRNLLSKTPVYLLLVTVFLLLSAFILPVTPAIAAETDPQCWGVFAGVSDYEFINDLDYADDDAIDLYSVFTPVWGAANTRLLVDSEASKADILDAIGWMADNAGENDTVVFTFSGHGTDLGELCTYDFYSSNSGISTTVLYQALSQVKAEKIVVIIDVCHAGEFQYMLSKDGRVLLLASQADELSQESYELRNGVFTYYILQAISEFDDIDTNHDYELSAEEIAAHASLMTSLYDYSQNPVIDDEFIGELALIAKFIFVLDTNLPPGTVILTLDGVDYTVLPPEKLWSPGSTHTIAVPEWVYVNSGTRYAFAGWNDGEALAVRVITKGFFSAEYNIEQLLKIVSPFGDFPDAGWYLDNSLAEFSVTPYFESTDTRHYFISWSGDFSGNAETGSLYMDSPKTVYANWRTEYLLNVSSEYGTPTGAGWYGEGETVSISVEPEQGLFVRQIFDGWTGDLAGVQSSVSFTMDSPKDITAIWHTDYVQLYILIIVILVVAGVVTATIILLRRRGSTPPVPPAAVPPPPPPPPAS